MCYLDNIEWDYPVFYTLFQDPCFLAMRENIHHIGCWFKVYIPSKIPGHSLPGWCHSIGTITVSSKIHSIILSGHLLQDGRELGKTRKFNDCGPTVVLWRLWSEFLGSNTVWDTMSIDKTFCNSMDGDFCRSKTCRKCKSLTRISMYSTKDKALCLHGWNGSV